MTLHVPPQTFSTHPCNGAGRDSRRSILHSSAVSPGNFEHFSKTVCRFAFQFNRTMANGTIEQQLQDHGIHPTAARILVLQKLSELTHPISMTELETELETMDKSTIFRTLNVLLEHHAIHSFEDGSGSTKYEICRCESTVCRVENRHIHFYCEGCNRTFCIDDVKIPVVELPDGYEIESINYTVKGLCPKCSGRKA